MAKKAKFARIRFMQLQKLLQLQCSFFLAVQKEKTNIPYKGNVVQCSCTVCNELGACFWDEGLIAYYNTISTISL